MSGDAGGEYGEGGGVRVTLGLGTPVECSCCEVCIVLVAWGFVVAASSMVFGEGRGIVLVGKVAMLLGEGRGWRAASLVVISTWRVV